MRLVTFQDRANPFGKYRVGALIDHDRAVVDFTSIDQGNPAFASMIGLMEAGDEGLDRARDIVDHFTHARGSLVLDRAAVKLMAPVPRPGTMRDWACFPEHLVNVGIKIHRLKAAREPDPEAAFERYRASGVLDLPKDYYELPRFHSSNPNGVIGPEDDAIWPRFSNLMDFELEFGIFIGKKGKDIPLEETDKHIFGYTIFNDFTARDMQMREARQGGKGKEFDTGSVLGPCIVTRDEIPDPYKLRMISRVNGEVWCDSNTTTMARTFGQIITHMSDSTTLYPGDFMGSGTIGGGSGLEIDRTLSDGDVIELEVEKIGLLRTKIAREIPKS